MKQSLVLLGPTATNAASFAPSRAQNPPQTT